MADQTRGGISWTDETWNPTTGCTVVSEGCKHCYAMQLAATRLAHQPRYAGTARIVNGHAQWTGKINLHREVLEAPLHWKRPRYIFVDSMSDLFHENIPDGFITEVFNVMLKANWHVFQVLTKRPERMARFIARWRNSHVEFGVHERGLTHIHCLTSIEDQKSAEERMPHLIDVQMPILGVSAEPLIGPVDIRKFLMNFNGVRKIAWLIAGGESSKVASDPARPTHPDWVRKLRDDCIEAGVLFHFKQWGDWMPMCTTDGRQEMPFGEYNVATKMGFAHVGKNVAGRILDRRTWDMRP